MSNIRHEFEIKPLDKALFNEKYVNYRERQLSTKSIQISTLINIVILSKFNTLFLHKTKFGYFTNIIYKSHLILFNYLFFTQVLDYYFTDMSKVSYLRSYYEDTQ